MKKIVFASGNNHKVGEVKELLKPFDIEIISMREAGFDGDPDETGLTFEENAAIKARAVYASLGLPCFADDSGLSVDALEGRPGIYSSRFSGMCPDFEGNDSRFDGIGKFIRALPADMKKDDRNIESLLYALRGTENRSARFVCSVFYTDGKTEFSVRGECEGHIISKRAGSGGFGYDPVFFCDALGKTLGEATEEEKNAVSHRGNAIRLFARELTSRI